MSIFSSPYFDKHEHVDFIYDADTGLRAIIAIHNSVLGPGCGGTRFLHYKNEQDAIDDVLRLSRGMTYKNSMAGTNWGGAKAVILAEENTTPSHALLQAFLNNVNQYNGRYLTGEDVGITNEIAEDMIKMSPYFIGLSRDRSIDFSQGTAIGVLKSIEAALFVHKSDTNLNGVRVSIQGLGKVGFFLAELLVAKKAIVLGCDPNPDRAQLAKESLGIEIVPAEDIYSLDVDVFSPCALGAVLNQETLPNIRAPIIAGSANNQLLDDEIGREVFAKGILYAPDYVANAGGVISGYENQQESIDLDRLTKNLDKVYDRTLEIFKRSKAQNLPTDEIADQMALERINAAAKKM